MSFVYWFVFLTVLALGKAAEDHPKSHIDRNGRCTTLPDTGAVILLSLILMLVSGLRYRVGADYMAYFRYHLSGWEQVWDKFLHFKEGGFAFIAMLSRAVFNHGQSLIFVSSLITVGLYCRTIYKYHAMFLVSLMLYIFTGQWQESFNIIRQCLAGAILFAGHRFILEKKPWHYFAVVLAASMFHISAVVMVIPYFLSNRKADLKQIIFLAVFAVIARFSYDYIFTLIEGIKGVTLYRANAYMSHSVNVFRIMVGFIPIVIYIVVCRKENQTKEQNFYINSLFFNAFALLAGMGSAYFGRIGVYTGAMVTIGYGHLFQLIDDERTRKMTVFATMLMFFLYWLYSLMVAGRDIRSYQWIFSAGAGS